MNLVITIDGPAGAGKSTVAKILAKRLGYLYLDSGAIYRALGLLAKEERVDFNDEEKLVKLSQKIKFLKLEWEKELRVYLGEREITKDIRGEEAGRWASSVSRHPKVRKALLNIQRGFLANGNVVAEGRDMGTVVFPDAFLKIFLVADLKERARRRMKDENVPFTSENIERFSELIRKRDEQDSERKTAPLKKAEDAVEIDTTSLTPSQVVDIIENIVKKKLSFK